MTGKYKYKYEYEYTHNLFALKIDLNMSQVNMNISARAFHGSARDKSFFNSILNPFYFLVQPSQLMDFIIYAV